MKEGWEYLVDTREWKITIPLLKRLGLSDKYKEYALNSGDFALRRNGRLEVGVERKQMGDLVSSIMSHRLEDQITRMRMQYNVYILMITGDLDEHIAYMATIGVKINKNVVLGQIASLAVRQQVQVMWFPDDEIGVDSINRILTKIVDGKYGKIERQRGKKLATPVDLLTCIPNISTKKALNLLKKFGSIANVSNASVEELVKVDGIGTATAALVNDILNRKK